MKRLLLVVGVVGCLVGMSLIGWSTRPPEPVDQTSLLASGTDSAPPVPADARPGSARRFADLPVGQTREVDFAADASALDQLTPREQRDQFRDWLLFAAVSSAGLSPEQVNQSLYDLPPIRHGYMRPIANLDYGEVRSCSIGDGQILALIPVCEGARRNALLAEIADAHRKNLGAEPRTLSVIEYELNPTGYSAQLTRREDLDAHTLFTADSGYHQRPVGSLRDLDEFLGTVDDVTFASLEGASLTLGGRKLADRSPKRVRAEDVAAIWQAERKLLDEIATFDSWVKTKEELFDAESKRQADALESRWSRRIDTINARLSTGLAKKKSPFDVTPPIGIPGTGFDPGSTMRNKSLAEAIARLQEAQGHSPTGSRGRLPTTNPFLTLGRTQPRGDDDFENATVIDEAEIERRQKADFEGLRSERKQAWEAVQAEIDAERSKHKLVRGSGFSLDPDFDFGGIATFVTKVVREVEGLQGGTGDMAITDAELDGIRDALRKGNLNPFRALVDRLDAADGPLSRALFDELRMLQLLSQMGGEFDQEKTDRMLSRLEAEVEALGKGRLPVGTHSEFTAMREAVAKGDEAPMRAWLASMRREDGLLAQALQDLVAAADDRFHLRSVADRAGLDAWLARVEAEAGEFLGGPGYSAPVTELRAAAEAARRGDDAPALALAARWKASDRLLTASIGDVLARSTPVYRFRGRLDADGLARLLTRVDKGVQSLLVGDRAPLSLVVIHQVREGLAKGDDGALRRLFVEPTQRDGRRFVDAAVMERLARATTPFRACDRQGLASRLDAVDKALRVLASGDSPILTAADVARARQELAAGPSAALQNLLKKLSGADNSVASELRVALGRESVANRVEDSKALARALDGFGPELRAVMSAISVNELRSIAQSLSGETKVAQGRGKEADQAIVPLLTWSDRLAKLKNPTAASFAESFERGIRAHRFQMARYDGDLKGTEVGMVLFYTDLLAKLWAIDYMHNHPAREIEDFHSMTDLSISPVFEEEIRRLSSTRLWFGHEDRGFQVAGDGSKLLLARNATRIYAASSSPLAPGAEAAAAANSEAFLGWWNDHYLEVARYEPEYQRLNQIMKWSLLISWLNEKNGGGSLGFLSDVSVDHSAWFPRWVEAHPELKYRRWDRIAFHEPGYQGSVTEAMPILSSEGYILFGRGQTLSGGVSLAPKELFKARAGLAEEVSPLVRRSNLNYAARSGTAGEGLSFKTLQESQYTFKPAVAGRSAMDATPKAGTKLRGRVSELLSPKGEAAAPSFGRTVSAEAGRWEIAANVSDHGLAALSIKPTRNGLRVGLQSRELATGQSLARSASRSPDPVAAIARHPGVEVAFGTPEVTYARLRGSKSWVKLTAETPGTAVAEGAERAVARVADTKAGSRPYDLAFIDEPAMKSALGKGESISIRVPESGGDGLPIRLSARGPPADAPLVSVEVEWSGGTIRGRFDPLTRELHIPRENLPSALLDNSDRFRTVLRESGVSGLKLDPARTGTVRLVAKEAQVREGQLLRDIEEGRFHPVARELAADPAEFSKKVNGEFKDALHACDELIRQGEHLRALDALSTLEDVYGGRVEIRLRQAVAEIKAGRPGVAARLTNEAMETGKADLRGLYEEINLRLSDPTLDPTARANLGRLRDASEWHEIQSSQQGNPGRIALAVDGDAIRLDYHLDREPSLGGGVPADDRVFKSDAPVYIMDAPGLNNLDWAASFQETLHGLVQGGMVKVVALQDAAIAEFRPTHLFVGQKAATATATRTTAYTNVRPSLASSSKARHAVGPALNSDDEEKKRRRRLAALLRESQAVAAEAFVILPVASKP